MTQDEEDNLDDIRKLYPHMTDVRSRTMVWAGEAGDRSLWYGGFRRGGERKVAERIIRQMQKDLFSK